MFLPKESTGGMAPPGPEAPFVGEWRPPNLGDAFGLEAVRSSGCKGSIQLEMVGSNMKQGCYLVGFEALHMRLQERGSLA